MQFLCRRQNLQSQVNVIGVSKVGMSGSNNSENFVKPMHYCKNHLESVVQNAT